MPVYEYECSACGGRFELMQKFSDPAPTACQLCKAEGVRKVLSRHVVRAQRKRLVCHRLPFG